MFLTISMNKSASPSSNATLVSPNTWRISMRAPKSLWLMLMIRASAARSKNGIPSKMYISKSRGQISSPAQPANSDSLTTARTSLISSLISRNANKVTRFWRVETWKRS